MGRDGTGSRPRTSAPSGGPIPAEFTDIALVEIDSESNCDFLGIVGKGAARSVRVACQSRGSGDLP